jgi:hypothetical protein
MRLGRPTPPRTAVVECGGGGGGGDTPAPTTVTEVWWMDDVFTFTPSTSSRAWRLRVGTRGAASPAAAPPRRALPIVSAHLPPTHNPHTTCARARYLSLLSDFSPAFLNTQCPHPRRKYFLRASAQTSKRFIFQLASRCARAATQVRYPVLPSHTEHRIR